MAVLEPERWARDVTVLDLSLPVESSWTCLMPVQNEPSERYHWPPEEMKRLEERTLKWDSRGQVKRTHFGSMALKFDEVEEEMTKPWSVHEP